MVTINKVRPKPVQAAAPIAPSVSMTSSPQVQAAMPVAENGYQSAWEMNDGLKALLYGQSGTGKTVLWSTFPSPILVLVCSGTNKPGELISIDTPENRKRIQARTIRSTEDFKEALADAPKFATTVLDHLSGLQLLDLKEVLGLSEIPAVRRWGDATQAQYGECVRHCIEYCTALLNLSGNVVLVAQERTFTGKDDGTSSELVKPFIGADIMPSFHRWLGPAVDHAINMYKRPRVERRIVEVNGAQGEVEVRIDGMDYCARLAEHDVYFTKIRKLKTIKLPGFIPDPSYDKLMRAIKGLPI